MSGYRILYAIGQFLESMSGCDLIIGENLFIGHIPTEREDNSDTPIRCVAVLANAPGDVIPDLPDWEEKAIQIWNRASYYMQAHDDAYCIFNAIHGTAGWTLPSVLGGPEYDVMVINAIGTPAVIENPNEKGEFVFSTNYKWSVANAP